jgi:nitrate/nitrite transporter NarK
VNKGNLLATLGFLAAAVYLFALPLGPGETIQVIPGHDLPDRFGVMLGFIAMVGAIAMGAEGFRASRKPLPRDSRLRHLDSNR